MLEQQAINWTGEFVGHCRAGLGRMESNFHPPLNQHAPAEIQRSSNGLTHRPFLDLAGNRSTRGPADLERNQVILRTDPTNSGRSVLSLPTRGTVVSGIRTAARVLVSARTMSLRESGASNVEFQLRGEKLAHLSHELIPAHGALGQNAGDLSIEAAPIVLRQVLGGNHNNRHPLAVLLTA